MAAPAGAQTNPNAARAQLQQNRTAARRNEAPNRAPVSEFQGGREFAPGGRTASSARAAQSAQVREDEFYKIARTPREERLQERERLLREEEHKRQFLEQKMLDRQKLRDFIQPPQEYQELPDDMRREPRIQEAYEDFAEGATDVISQDRSTAARVRQRLQTLKQLKEKQKKLAEQVKKIKDLMKKAKQAKDVAWTGGSIATEAEDEFALGGTANIPGKLASMYRVAKSILFPTAQTSNDPDAGQLLKGVLSFFEPTAVKAKDITSWLAGIHALWGFLFLFIALVVLAALLLVIGGGMFLTDYFNLTNFAG